MKELLKDGNVTYRQLETMKHQLEEIKKKEQELVKYPDIRIITQKIDGIIRIHLYDSSISYFCQ